MILDLFAAQPTVKVIEIAKKRNILFSKCFGPIQSPII